jgi:hypothetical protein
MIEARVPIWRNGLLANAIPMKFDPARATAIFEKLGEPGFQGPAGEERVADCVAGEFERMGLSVERREVHGSRFPQRAGPWIWWLGYGILISTLFATLLLDKPIPGIIAFLLLAARGMWALDASTRTAIRLGRRMRPIVAAPLAIAQTPDNAHPSIRIVFQAVLGGVRRDILHSVRMKRIYVYCVHAVFISLVGLTLASKFGKRPERGWFLLPITTLVFIFLWIAILFLLFWEYRQSRLAARKGEVERWGLTALLELARVWPRHPSRQIEAVFVAAGGQRLDFAGSREVLRILESEWPRKPSLLVLLIAPGAGERLRPSEKPLRIAGRYQSGTDLAKDAAASLWIPIQTDDLFSLLSYWPSEKLTVVEPVALIGSDPSAHFEASDSPEALQRATQLAMEIALRWAKQKAASADAGLASSVTSSGPNELGDATP